MADLERVTETYVTVDTELAGWMKELEPFRWRDEATLNRDETALPVVDMTRPFVDDTSRPLCSANARTTVARIKGMVDAFMRDFTVLYAADGTAAINRALHIAALQTVAGWGGHVVASSSIVSQLVPGTGT